MALPTSYTEDEVKAYMEKVLGDTAHKLGWSVEGDDFDEAVNEVLLLLDQPDFTFVDTRAEVKKVRAVARMEAWRQAMYNSAHMASHSVGAPGTGQSSRGGTYRQIADNYKAARRQVSEDYPALILPVGRDVERWPVTYEKDYYGNQPS